MYDWPLITAKNVMRFISDLVITRQGIDATMISMYRYAGSTSHVEGCNVTRLHVRSLFNKPTKETNKGSQVKKLRECNMDGRGDRWHLRQLQVIYYFCLKINKYSFRYFFSLQV